MKYLLTISLLLFGFMTIVQAQADKTSRKSPPIVDTYTIGAVEIILDYSSPSIRGRELWGGLVPMDAVWRTGANEASKISISDNVIIEGQVLDAGTYSVFTIPSAEHWTVIFNTVEDQWGSNKYDESKDALRVEVAPKKNAKFVESMKMDIEANKFNIKWGNLTVPVEVAVASK